MTPDELNEWEMVFPPDHTSEDEKIAQLREKIHQVYFDGISAQRRQKNISESTRQTYERNLAKIDLFRKVAPAGQPFTLSSSKNSATVYSSALRYRALKRLPNARSREDLLAVIDDIEFAAGLKKQMQDGVNNELKQRLRKLEKKHGDWREQLDAKMLKSKYFAQYIVQRVTGCRPEELCHGVQIERVGANEFLLHVFTAKGRADDTRTDRTRIIRSNNPFLNDLAGTTVAFNKKEKDSYRMCFASATRTLFGQQLSPYALRYSIAADMKSEGVPTTERAEILGHESTQYHRLYSSNVGKGGREHSPSIEKARVQVQERKVPSHLAKQKPESAQILP